MVFKRLRRLLDRNDCGNHHWGSWSEVYTGTDNVIYMETQTKVFRKRKHRRRCQHEGCDGEEEKFKRVGSLGKRKVKEAMDGDRQIVINRHIDDEYRKQYMSSSHHW